MSQPPLTVESLKSSVFSLLTSSKATNRLESVFFGPAKKSFQLKVRLQIIGDSRTHLIVDTVRTVAEAAFILDTLSYQHESLHPEDAVEMQRWREAMTDTRRCEEGISLRYGC